MLYNTLDWHTYPKVQIFKGFFYLQFFLNISTFPSFSLCFTVFSFIKLTLVKWYKGEQYKRLKSIANISAIKVMVFNNF